MRRTILQILPVSVAVWVGGCPAPFFTSEEGQWSFQDSGLVVGGSSGLNDDTPLLEGSTVCPTPSYMGTCPEETGDDDDSAVDGMALLLDCFDHSADGPGSIQQATSSLCVLGEGIGELTWNMDPLPCAVPDGGCPPVADRVVFELLAAEDLQAKPHPWVDLYALEALAPAAGEAFPGDLLLAEGEPIQILADAEVVLLAHLWDSTGERAVAWNEADGGAAVRSVQGSSEITDPMDKGFVRLRLSRGAEAVLELRVGEHAWDVATLIGVGEEVLASVELVTAFAPSMGGDLTAVSLREPFGARALFRDALGRPVHGVPVQWRVRDGILGVEPGITGDYTLPGADYALLSDDCVRPSEAHGERSATLEVSYGNLSDARDLVWTRTLQPGVDGPGWEPSEDCMSGGGCSCDVQGGTSPEIVPILMLTWVSWRRCRRS